jgi:putative FmdB family regulatory protein
MEMPTYEYKCSACGHTFEEMHGIDDRVDRCPSCGGVVRRLFHPVGIIFKGSGFYKTDSRGSSDNGGKKTSPARAEKKPAADGAAASGGKEEASPAKGEGSVA